MTTKTEAKLKILAASEASALVQQSRQSAFHLINGSWSTNGYGVFHDRFEVQNALLDARQSIDHALEQLHKAEWPTSADYDKAEG